MPQFKAWINPLKCPPIDFEKSAAPTAEQLLDYLFAPELDRGPDKFVIRYREIAGVTDPLFVAPAEQNILQKLVWPLRHAKGSYALGNYLGCIALCGMVGEMVAMLLWDISKFSLQQKRLDEAAQADLLGSSFEKLGQERRTRVLRVLDLIGKDDADAFDGLRLIRRRYLHFFSQPHEKVAKDATESYKYALKVVATVLGPKSVENGIVALRDDLVRYLEEQNITEATPEKQT